MRRNPYRAYGVPYKPWWTYGHYMGRKTYISRHWFRWQAIVHAMDILTVEYVDDQNS